MEIFQGMKFQPPPSDFDSHKRDASWVVFKSKIPKLRQDKPGSSESFAELGRYEPRYTLTTSRSAAFKFSESPRPIAMASTSRTGSDSPPPYLSMEQLSTQRLSGPVTFPKSKRKLLSHLSDAESSKAAARVYDIRPGLDKTYRPLVKESRPTSASNARVVERSSKVWSVEFRKRPGRVRPTTSPRRSQVSSAAALLERAATVESGVPVTGNLSRVCYDTDRAEALRRPAANHGHHWSKDAPRFKEPPVRRDALDEAKTKAWGDGFRLAPPIAPNQTPQQRMQKRKGKSVGKKKTSHGAAAPTSTPSLSDKKQRDGSIEAARVLRHVARLREKRNEIRNSNDVGSTATLPKRRLSLAATSTSSATLNSPIHMPWRAAKQSNDAGKWSAIKSSPSSAVPIHIKYQDLCW